MATEAELNSPIEEERKGESSETTSPQSKKMDAQIIQTSLQEDTENLGTDYAQFADFKADKERKRLDDRIEDLLLKLEEYWGLMDIIGSDTNLCLTRTLPEIYVKSLEMQTIFDKIDQLESFLEMVKVNMNEMEDAIEQLEAEVGTFSGVKKLLSGINMPSFLGKKLQVKSSTKTKVKLPQVFSTEDYFPPDKEEEENKTANETNG